jgi:drug/metabolite transporter (DMT)-like permease
MAAPLRMGGREWAMLALLSVLWGATFLFVRLAVTEVPPFTIVLVRVGLAALALNAVLVLTGRRLPTTWTVARAFLGMALINNVVPFSLLVWGQTQIASGLAAILNATTPLFTVLVAHAFTTDEKLTPARLAGVLLGFVGVAVLVGPSVLGARHDLLAELACFGAALAYALAGIFGRRFKRLNVAPFATATGQVSASTLILLPLALLVDRPWTLSMPEATVIGALAGLALLSTVLAYVLYFRILSAAGATNLLLVTFLVPITALILGALVLDEAIEARSLAGMALIGSGLAALDGRPVAWLHRGLTQTLEGRRSAARPRV